MTYEEDLAWRPQAEEERDRLFEMASELMIIAGSDGFIRSASASCSRVTGWSLQELRSRPYVEFTHPDDQALVINTLTRVLAGETVTHQARVWCKDGSLRLTRWTAAPGSTAGGTLCAVGRDMTEEAETRAHLEGIIAERTRAEERLRGLLEEKAVLLREVHHRVKNNLAVIASQLYLQSTYAADEATVQMLQEMRDRVRSMALVHETLYESGDPGRVDAATYVRALAEHLLRSYRSPLMRVALDLDLAHGELDVELAIPCGLILTELLTNSLKHAFAAGVEGRIRVSLEIGPDECVRLEVSDTGAGLPADVDVASARTLGLRLVRSLASQIEAQLTITPGAPGTRVTLLFPLRARAGEAQHVA